MSDALLDVVRRNRGGALAAIPSVCSAHPGVLRASLRLAERLDRAVVVEATSNQVNQDGGYTGMRPADFLSFVHEAAAAAGADPGRIIFGGDHLGTQVWRKEAAQTAMEKARALVAGYVTAGFGKIHLDCSEGCASEPAQLPDQITAERSADLAVACLEASRAPETLSFVIGTEVPPPGGARVDEDGDIPATRPDAARATLEAHRAAFEARGIGAALDQVLGLVVQPGVEFSPMHVHHLPPDRDPGLRAVAETWPNLCLEAHSTDYQHDSTYPRLAELGFAFQKVGPALTFAWREALYALDMMREAAGWGKVTVMPTMGALMLRDPGYWRGHYRGSDEETRLQRHFGYADRIRYYWPMPEAQAVTSALLADLAPRHLPRPLLTQFFADEVIDRAESIDLPLPEALLDASVERALAPYFF